MPKNRENLIFNNGLAQCQEALEYKSSGACDRAIQLLQKIITKTRKEKNSLEEVHLIGIIQENLGIIYMDIDKNEEALYYFDKAVLNFGMVLEHYPNNIGLYEAQAFALTNMAMLYRMLQKYNNAITYSEKAITCYEEFELRENSKKDNIYAIKGNISMIRAEMADVNEKNKDKANRYIQDAIDFYDLALEINPTDYEYRKDKSLSEITLANNFSQNKNKMNEALELMKNAIKILEKLLEIKDNDEQVKISCANSKSNIGRIYQAVGDIYLALKYFKEATRDYEKQLKNDPLNYEIIDNIAVNLNNIANIYIHIDKKNEVSLFLELAIGYYNLILEDNQKKEINIYKNLIITEVIYHKTIAQIDLSKFYIKIGELKKAKKILTESITDLDKAIKENRSNINFLNQKALAITIQSGIKEIEKNNSK